MDALYFVTLYCLLGAGEPTASTTPAKPPEGAKPHSAALDPAQVAGFAIDPPAIKLDDPRARKRVLISGTVNGAPADLTDLATITSSNPAVAVLNERFEVVPLGDGSAEIVAKWGNHQAKATVTVTQFTKGRPVNFPNEIVPIFTKLTCNSGGCHGKSGGQNGFALSLLGFVANEDHDFLVRESRGRRLFPAAPTQSLLLRKATGQAPHGGGKLMKVGDDNYQLLVHWMRQGMPFGTDKDPAVTKIDIEPARRILRRGGTQRVRVTASYSDGRTEDVTRYTLFESNNTEVAAVDAYGKVTANDLAGEAAIMARCMGQVTVFRATVPTGMTIDKPQPFVVKNFIDEATSKKWQLLGLAPSVPTNDHQIIRRLYIDLCGKLPTPQQVGQFVVDADPNKREKLIDQLLASEDYAAFMAMKWGAVLQNKRAGRQDYAPGTHAMSLWLKDAFYHDMPYDQFARAVLTASGVPERNPPVVWYRSVRTVEENVDHFSQLFLGTRVQCARCHHHPFEKWSQDDYYSMASFFSRVARKNYAVNNTGNADEAIFVARGGMASHPKKGIAMKPSGLGGEAYDVPAGADPRAKLADWLAKPDNPFFAATLVNRLWGHFLGIGIVDPIDDMRVTNPPTNPELLRGLAQDFVKNGFRVKRTIKMICMSSTYQLSSEPNPYNLNDKQNFARYYPRRLQAEVLLDAMDQVTAVPTGFGYPAGMRAVDLPDEQIGSYFLDIFGRPQRASSCECERSGEANLSQALHLLNSNDVHAKLTAGNGRAALYVADKRPDTEKVTELFLWFYARPPRPEELQAALEHVNTQKDKRVAYQNLVWALLNTKEFLFKT